VGEVQGLPQRNAIAAMDYHSKWPEVRLVSTVTTESVIEFLSELFARWGFPEELVSAMATIRLVQV
jgi:HD-like signal output (HDOD) protein